MAIIGDGISYEADNAIFSQVNSVYFWAENPEMNFQLLQWKDTYYVLNVCVSPKFVWWNPNLKVIMFGERAFGQWVGHEYGTLTHRICAQMKNTQTPLWSLLPWEATVRRGVSVRQEVGSHETIRSLAP